MSVDLEAIRERCETLCDVNVVFRGKERRHLNATLGILLVDDIPALIKEVERLREALGSIARNACCDKCQEAKLVAIAALE